MTLASRIGVMRGGEILQVGSPTDIYEFPNSRFVADFIGSVNMMSGRLTVDEADHARVDCPELGTTVYIDHGVSGPPDSSVSVALRPEKIQLSATKPAQSDNVISGVIAGVAYLGGATRYLVRLPTGFVLKVTEPNVHRHEAHYQQDEVVWLCWDGSAPVVVTR
jgi:putrescine transport system ATP-binding protein